jgi:hypothetical protein
MKRSVYFPVVMILILVLNIFPGKDCNAIPAFARKYQISCQVCHSPAMPSLKAFGDEFAGNGFRLTEYESPRYFVPTGDDRLSLFRELPLAVRMDGFASYNFNNEESADFSAPFVLKILSGGEISDKLSYYFYFLLNERGSIAGVEDAFLMYRDLFKTGINFYIGQFQASDPLFKGELRYTLEPYAIYAAAPGNSVADLKYDRGLIFERGFSTGTTVVGQILNGNGIGEAREGFLFDGDKYKNFMLRLNQSVGKSLGVGVFGYFGKEDLFTPLTRFTNTIKMVGPDISLNIDELVILNMQYLWRLDSDVYSPFDFMAMAQDIMTQGGFAELIYAPKGDMSKWYLTGLFNWIESDQNSLDYQSATLHAGYLLRRNLRVVTEFTQLFGDSQYGKLSAGFVTAF